MSTKDIISIIEEAEKIELTDNEVLRICQGQVNIVNVLDFARIKSLDEVFRKHPVCVIFWAVDSAMNGHFTTLLEHKNEIEHFDPYGYSIGELFHLSTYSNEKLNGRDVLSPLINAYCDEYMLRFTENTHDFQSKRAGVNTCGRYAAVRARFCDLEPEEFMELLTCNKLDPDEIVSLLTLLSANRQELDKLVSYS